MKARSTLSSWLRGIVLAAFVPAGVTAQSAVHAPGATGSWTYLDSLPAPDLRSDLGGHTLPITTSVPRAQAFFDQGMAMNHGFWEVEAYRAFREATRLDPDAAMAWWGLYETVRRFAPRERADEAEAALAAARSLAEAATDVERRYIRATVVRDSVGGTDGKVAYEAALEALIEAHADQVHARLLLARSLGFSDPYGRAILEGVVRSHPDLAAGHHYWLHAWETTSEERALPSAEVIAELAPGIGHLVHMPGHTYYALGRYEDAILAFRSAARVDQAHLRESGIAIIDQALAVHNIHYLSLALAEVGRRDEAYALADSLAASLTISPDRTRALQRFSYFYQGLVLPVKVALRFSDWDAASRALEALPPDDPDLYGATSPLYRAALRDYVGGQQALGRADLQAAAHAAETLAARLWRAQREGPYPSWLHRLLGPMALELDAGVALGRAEGETAIRLLESAVALEDSIVGMTDPPYYARPTREALAGALLELGRAAEALEVAEAALAIRPASPFAESLRDRATAVLDAAQPSTHSVRTRKRPPLLPADHAAQVRTPACASNAGHPVDGADAGGPTPAGALGGGRSGGDSGCAAAARGSAVP